MKKLLLTFALLGVVLTACNKEIVTKESGELTLNIHSDGEFTATKSEDVVNVKDFAVSLKDNAGVEVESWDKFSSMPSVLVLDPGNYTISANSPGNKDAAFSQPLYAGNQAFKIESGSMVDLDLVCTLKNMKVTILCTERFIRELNDDFTITVSTDYGFLVYDKAAVVGELSGYFKVAPMTVFVQGTRKLGGSVVNHQFQIVEVAAKDHHVLKIDAKETGEINIGESGITVDYTLNNRQHDVIIGGWDEGPVDGGGDGGDGGDNPVTPPAEDPITVTAPGIDAPLTITDAQSQTAVIDVAIGAAAGISELKVTINSVYLETMLSNMSLPASFDMANLSAAEAEFVNGLGLLANGPVAGKTSYSFSIGGFMALIESNIPVEQQTHQFVIAVKDANGNVLSKTITIKRVA